MFVWRILIFISPFIILYPVAKLCNHLWINYSSFLDEKNYFFGIPSAGGDEQGSYNMFVKPLSAWYVFIIIILICGHFIPKGLAYAVFGGLIVFQYFIILAIIRIVRCISGLSSRRKEYREKFRGDHSHLTLFVSYFLYLELLSALFVVLRATF